MLEGQKMVGSFSLNSMVFVIFSCLLIMRSGVQVLAAKISLAVSSQSAHLDFKLLYWIFLYGGGKGSNGNSSNSFL